MAISNRQGEKALLKSRLGAEKRLSCSLQLVSFPPCGAKTSRLSRLPHAVTYRCDVIDVDAEVTGYTRLPVALQTGADENRMRLSQAGRDKPINYTPGLKGHSSAKISAEVRGG